MNPPEWPGQVPPGQPGFPPPPPGQPYGQPGYGPGGYGGPGGPGGPIGPGGPGFPPGPPRPSRGGGGAVIGVLIGGGVLVLAVIVVAAFVILGDDDGGRKRRTITAPTYSAAPSESGAPTPAPSDPGGIGTGLGAALTPTISTGAGNTFTRVGTRTASCTSRADADLAKALVGRSCVEDMESAVYANSGRNIITVISILKFSDASTASEVSDATSEGANPELLIPSANSGIPRLDRKPTSWVRSWTQGQHVVYAQSYYASGTEPGSRTGVVYTTAGELGLKVTSALMNTN